MKISYLSSRLRQLVADHGVLGTLRITCVRAYRTVRPPVTVTHPFDLSHGVDTSGLIVGRKLRSKHASASHITAYWGTAPSMFYALLERWQATLPSGLRLEDYAFVDIGCGKGRVVMLASEFPFQQVTGVELIASLAQIAQRNLLAWQATQRACGQLSVIQADALAYVPPEKPLLVYLFNPFDRPLVEAFVGHLIACVERQRQVVDVLYLFPFHSECFANSPAIELVWNAEFGFSAEDAAADIFGSRLERCHLYRISPGSQDNPEGD